MAGALDAVEALRATRSRVLATTLEASAEPLALNLARGFAVPWDTDFETVKPLPAYS